MLLEGKKLPEMVPSAAEQLPEEKPGREMLPEKKSRVAPVTEAEGTSAM
jgi:hypothetical protein